MSNLERTIAMIESGDAMLLASRRPKHQPCGAKPMSTVKPITVGLSFGRLTVITQSVIRKSRHYCYECACDCGKIIVVKASSLQSGNTQSCGCRKKDLLSARRHIHGHARHHHKTTTYYVWQNMLSRCQNDRSTSWRWYGARGIQVCERWQIFENFLADMGKRPPGRSIDRINNDGNYEPGNCRWATRQAQDANKGPKKS